MQESPDALAAPLRCDKCLHFLAAGFCRTAVCENLDKLCAVFSDDPKPIQVTPEMLEAVAEYCENLCFKATGQTLRELACTSQPAPLEPWERCRALLENIRLADGEPLPSFSEAECRRLADAAREGTVPQHEYGRVQMLADNRSSKLKASIPIAEVVALLERLRVGETHDSQFQTAVAVIKAQLDRYSDEGFSL